MLTRSQRKQKEALETAYKEFVNSEVRIECHKDKGREHGAYVVVGDNIAVLTCLTEMLHILMDKNVVTKDQLTEALAMACIALTEDDEVEDESE